MVAARKIRFRFILVNGQMELCALGSENGTDRQEFTVDLLSSSHEITRRGLKNSYMDVFLLF